MTEEIKMTEEEAEAIWTTYLLYKYEFLQSEMFNKCPNRDRCLEDNLHYCGCFQNYLLERDRLTRTEIAIREDIEKNQ